MADRSFDRDMGRDEEQRNPYGRGSEYGAPEARHYAETEQHRAGWTGQPGAYGQRGYGQPGSYGEPGWYGQPRQTSGAYARQSWYGQPGGYGAQGSYSEPGQYGGFGQTGGRYGQSDAAGERSPYWQPSGYGLYGGYGEQGSSGNEPWKAPGPHTGRGPRGYQRSDERIMEDICERLTEHGQVDASDIEVSVSHGEVTLQGTVTDRRAKRLAEDIAESVSGIRDIHNRLRVQAGGDSQPQTTGRSGQVQ